MCTDDDDDVMMEKFLRSLSQILHEGRGRKPPFFFRGYLLSSHKLKLVSGPDPSDKPCGYSFTELSRFLCQSFHILSLIPLSSHMQILQYTDYMSFPCRY
jgi:hypothetical protein